MRKLTLNPTSDDLEKANWSVAAGKDANALAYGSVAIGDNAHSSEPFGVDFAEPLTLPQIAYTEDTFSVIAMHFCWRELLPEYPTKAEQLRQLRRLLTAIAEKL